MRHRSRTALLSTALLIVTGCATATPPAGAPSADRLSPILPGSTWVTAEKATGSYGSGARQLIIRVLGEQTWEGRKVWALSEGDDNVVYMDTAAQGRLVGRTRGGRVVERYFPYSSIWEWPLFVGKTWTNVVRFEDDTTGRKVDGLTYRVRVEAYEDVATPAGTFKAFKVTYSGPSATGTSWYSPDLGMAVKTRIERLSNNSQGAGTREWELVSHALKR